MDTFKKTIYNLGIDIAAFFMTLGVVLILPFKFIQFLIYHWKRRNKQKKAD